MCKGVVLLFCCIGLLFPFAFSVSAETNSQKTVSFNSSQRLFQSPTLDILGYEIFVTADLSHQQSVNFLNTVDKTFLGSNDQVVCSASLSPDEPDIVFSLTFHFGGRTYTYEKSINGVQAPGFNSFTNSIPIGVLLASLGLPPLPINLDLSLNLQSQLIADMYTSGFISTRTQYTWTSVDKKESTLTFTKTGNGMANAFLSGIRMQIDISGRISISVPIVGTYTLYEFPIVNGLSYSADDVSIAKYYRLNVSSSYIVTTGSGWYYDGTTATFAVTSPMVEEGIDTRHLFRGWSGVGINCYSGSLNTATVVMSSPINESALWETQYLLTIQTDQGGSINPLPGTYWKRKDSLISVSANPNEGHVFENWIIDGSVVSNDRNYSLTMNAPCTIVAIFKESTSYVQLGIISAVVAGGTAATGLVIWKIRKRKR
jgi:hypothetical protein